jgi:hypothetical protein
MFPPLVQLKTNNPKTKSHAFFILFSSYLPSRLNQQFYELAAYEHANKSQYSAQAVGNRQRQLEQAKYTANHQTYDKTDNQFKHFTLPL